MTDTPASAPHPAIHPAVGAYGLPATTPPIDWAEIKRFADTLATIDRSAVPPDPLARRLHLAVEELDRAGVGEPADERLAELLAPIHSALTILDGSPIEGMEPRALLQLALLVDDAKSLLETPDLGEVSTDRLAGRLVQLYRAIVRLRGASVRLHHAWRLTAPPPGTGG